MSIAYIYALSAIVLWSTLAVLSLKLSAVPPFLLVGTTLLMGGLCGLPWIRDWRVPKATLALGIYGLFAYHLFLFLGLRSAPPVEANLINYLWPLLIVLLSPVFLNGYRLRLIHFISGVLGFLGAALVVTAGQFSFTGWHIGYGYAALAALIWSTYSLLSKRVSPFSTGAVGLFCVVSGLMALLCHIFFEPAYTWRPEDWPFVIAISLGPMGLAFFLWDAALKKGDPRVIGTLAYLTPLLSTAFLVVAGQGQFTWVSGVAMGLILSGAFLGSRKSI